MEEDHYDEFGNYIGPELNGESSEEEDIQDQVEVEEDEEDEVLKPLQEQTALMNLEDIKNNAIILHEDKEYYPSANEVYGDEVEALVQEEDTMALNEPIVEPIKNKKYSLLETNIPELSFDKEFLIESTNYPDMIYNVAIIGNLHSGKSTLVDTFVEQTHALDMEAEHLKRYCDIHNLERKRGLSLKCNPISLILQDLSGKSSLFNFMDTPGHVNFSDEVSASLRISDGVVLVVDAVEGVMMNTEKLIVQALNNNLKVVLLINKIDRLILELKLPLNDAYFKLRHTIEEINSIIRKHNFNQRLSPELGNVCFAASNMGYCFTTYSFAKLYSDYYGGIDATEFSKRLWGDIYFEKKSSKFKRLTNSSKHDRTFISFILEPLYKIYTQVLSESEDILKQNLYKLGIQLKAKEYKLDSKKVLKLVLNQFFGNNNGLIESIKQNILTAKQNNVNKVEQYYLGDNKSLRTIAMKNCDSTGPLMIQITKLYPTQDATKFNAFGRIMSGSIRIGQEVRVLGEKYNIDDEEDMTIQTIEGLFIYQSRYFIPVDKIGSGNWVLISGIDNTIVKTATITSMGTYGEKANIFLPLKYATQATMKIAIEPVNPTELPKMLEGLRKIEKSYSIVKTKTEESGEHIILGTGELYLDCILHDLRRLYSEIEIKVSDPVVKFCETVSETSSIKCPAETPNKKNKFTVISEPLEEKIVKRIEKGEVNKMNDKQIINYFEKEFQWDKLASRSIWAFGPDLEAPTNLFLNDTLPNEVDQKTLKIVKDYVNQGFKWAIREGPLCDEPIRNVKFRLLDATLANENIARGAGQIIPTARRVCYSAFLTASPKLMEPIYSVEIQAPADCVQVIYSVLARRRGHVISDNPKAGSPLYTIKALLPVMDGNGFETDLRTHTMGQAFCQLDFDSWQIVPGDPLDSNIKLRPLEPASGTSLARDFMLKSRRRKGLSEDVSITKFFDDPLLIQLIQGLK
ncbi:u5 small nuclear ribonucleoprotein component [Neoconidiobolus thromboides FSU 785]|nr:u5 small nuclear ribonucleoprotein component [Neoconidiobolus thromboides FSU 785]